MDLSVIIVNYNVRQFLENTLSSLKQSEEGLEVEIFVVDNASGDGSVEMVKEKFPDVHLIENSTNLGFAKANNLALREAKGRYMLLLNPDTVVQEDTLRVIVQFLDEHEGVELAGCKILNPDGSFQFSCRRGFPTPWVSFAKIFGLSSIFPRSKLFGRYHLTYLDPDETYPVDALSGSFMMFSRRAYETIGGLDESFFMYGEDIDYCYRIQQAGMKVYYVPTTQIIHYKGESTRRSSIDEINVFYDAMRIFVRKHFSHSLLLGAFLSIGISLRAAAAFIGRAGKPLSVAMMDFALLMLAMMAAEFLRYGGLFTLPSYAYPAVWLVPPLIVVAANYFFGVYTSNRHSVSRSGLAVLLSFLMISALVFFVKEYAFSRIVVGIAGLISILLVPGWRLLFRITGSGLHGASRRSLFGRRTLIVGTGPSARAVVRKLRARVDDGYEMLGFASTNRREVGEKIEGLDVLASTDNVGKVIQDSKITEVIFSTDGLSYKDILSVISKSSAPGVNFRLVPNSLEAIIGKASIDELEPIPLVDIEYNLHRSANRAAKRLFDIILSIILIVTVYPWSALRWLVRGRNDRKIPWPLLLPLVFSGRMSFVGLPPEGEGAAAGVESTMNGQASSLGPYGLTGIVQIQRTSAEMESDDVERLKLYYARNQSLGLDVEILLKSILSRKEERV